MEIKINLNQNGSILVTALIFAATSLVITGYISVSMINSVKERVNAEKSMLVQIMSRSIETALIVQSQCPALMPGASYLGLLSQPIPQLRIDGKTLTAGSVIKGDLKINQISLSPIAGKPPIVVAPGLTQHFATLNLDFDGGSSWIKKNKSTSTELRLTTNNITGNITSCAQESFFQISGQAPTCVTSGLSSWGSFTVLGSTYQFYYMMYKISSGVYYYCIVPTGGTAGYMTGCAPGRCPWN